MTKPKKIVIISLTSVIFLCGFVVFGFRGFVSSIRSQRTCEWANIDNIELHAHVDIPKLTKWDCNYEKETNTKKASFTIKTAKFDMEHYIQRNKLIKLNANVKLPLADFLNFPSDSINTAAFYYKKSILDGENSMVLLDKKSGSLWVTIQYKD